MTSKQLNIPYATKVLQQEFSALNLHMKFDGDDSGNINRINLDILTPYEWGKYCEGREISNHSSKSFDKDEKNTPYDIFLGILDPKMVCPTCGVRGINCQNHFGIIPLCIPVYNKIFFKTIIDVMNCCCGVCGGTRRKRSFVNIKTMGISRKSKLREVKKICENTVFCEGCNSELFYFTSKDKLNIHKYKTGDDVEKVGGDEIYEFLSNIKNWAIDSLGFLDPKKKYEENFLTTTIKKDGSFRPESMMFINYPVLPTCCRPWIVKDGVRNDDDLTDMYNQLIKINNKVRSVIEETPNNMVKTVGRKSKVKSLDTLLDDLQIAANNIITTKDVAISKVGKKKLGIIDRLCKKEGHIINNVGGKRCNYTGRGVIVGGGPLIPVGWVGVPRNKAEILTKEEMVTEFNLSFMKNLLKDNKITHIERNGRRLFVKRMQDKKIFIGDKVHRKIRDGDVAIWNRQPSIRVESMQGHRIMLIDSNAYRMSTSETRAFNADFDGDEMNLSIVQTIDAEAELGIVAPTSQSIVTAQNNSALMACVQNTLIVMYYITNVFNEEPKEFLIKKAYFFDAVMTAKISHVDYENFIKRVKKYYPELWIKKNIIKIQGKRKTSKTVEVLSDYIPGRVVASIIFPKDFYWRKRTNTNPNFPEVFIKDGIIQKGSGPLCKKIIGSGNTVIQYLYCNYSPREAQDFITKTSFIAYSILPLIGFSIGISDSILKDRKRLDQTIDESLEKAREIHMAEKDRDERERKIGETLNGAMSIAPILANTHMNKNSHNAYTIMRISGTKGNDANTGMIAAMVGQQNIDGKRPKPSITNKSRTFVHFPADEDIENPLSRGFIDRSYPEGLTLPQVFMQSISGRRGVIDTAAKTASSGYSQKKIGKKVEDSTIYPDSSVRNTDGYIINYIYGGDGMNPKQLSSVDGLDFPFFIDPTIESNKLNSSYSNIKPEKLPNEVIDLICNIIHVSQPDFESIIVDRVNYNMRCILRCLLKKILLIPTKITEFCIIIREKFERSKIPYGSTVGMVCCLSIGEIVMQLTLDSHRTAGSAAGKKDVTTGLPRFKEILDTTHNARTSMSFKMKRMYTQLEALRLSKIMSETKISDMITKEIEFFPIKNTSVGPYYEKFFQRKRLCIFEREKWLTEYQRIFGFPFCIDSKDIIEKPSEWVMVLNIDLKKLYSYNLDLFSLTETINSKSYDEKYKTNILWAIPSPLKIGKIAIFCNTEIIKIETSTRKKPLEKYITPENRDYYLVTRGCKEFVLDIIICGITGIKKIIPNKESSIKSQIIDEKEHFIFNFVTNGSNLRDILSIKEVDESSVHTSDFWEYSMFDGISSGKTCIYRELLDVISAGGTSSINPRHTHLLIDSMTRTGMITSANRHGIKDSSFTSKIMFETPIEQLKMASLYGEVDNITSMSSSVFVGSLGKFGSGVVEK